MASIHDNFESPIEKKYKLGFQLGGFAKIGLSEKFYLQPELLYSLQGTKFGEFDLTFIQLPQNDLDDLFAQKVDGGSQNESNIILPIILRYYFNEKFFVGFGPQLDFLFHTKADDFKINDNGRITYNDSSSESKFNFGLNLGVGYYFNEKMGLNFRYNYGFNRLDRSNQATSKYDLVSRNSVFSLSLEYQFIK